MISVITGWLWETWLLLALSAPWLLGGFLAAGIVRVLIPQRAIEGSLKQPGKRSVALASLIGIPLPLCSCSVIPVAVSLRRSGASKGATASFMVSTPEIGVDSFLLSYILLGPVLALSRVAAAFVSALAVGLSIEKWAETDKDAEKRPAEVFPACCRSQPPKADSCMTGQTGAKNWREKATAALRYGFVDVLDDLAKLLLAGFLIAGAAAYLLPPDLVSEAKLPDWAAMGLAVLVSLPVYVCSTSATPLAAALLIKGVAPGAILVFLLAGPATNITTMLAVNQELGRRAAVLYVSSLVVTTVGAGLLLQSVVGNTALVSAQALDVSEHLHLGPLQITLALVMLALLFRSIAANDVFPLLGARSRTAASSPGSL